MCMSTSPKYTSAPGGHCQAFKITPNNLLYQRCVFEVGHFPTFMPKCADSQDEIATSFLRELGKKTAEEKRFGFFVCFL